MFENGKISNRQFSILVILFTVGTTTMIVPALVSKVAKQDAWIATILNIAFGVMLTFLYCTLAKRYPDLTFAQLSEKILGKWLGKAVSLLVFLFYILLLSSMLRIVGDMITTHMLTETPIQAVEAVFLFTIVLGTRYGLETFSRSSEMLFPHVMAFFVLLLLFLLPQVKGTHITPILEHGIKPVLIGTYHIIGLPFLELFIFLMITPYVKDVQNIRKNMIVSIIVGGAINTLITILATLVLGNFLTAKLNFPPFVLAQRIDIGNFIQRIEVLSGAFIFISIFIKMTVCFYAMSLSFAQTMELKNYRVITLPLGLIILVLSINLFPNIIFHRTFILSAWTPLLIFFGLIIPLFLLAVDMMRGRFKKNQTGRMNKPQQA